VKIQNKWNKIPIAINMIWVLIILFTFIFKVPEFEKAVPDGASYLITGIVLLTICLFVISLIYMLISNRCMKIKIYYDLIYLFIPIIILAMIIIYRL
jgi:hypothetical protein